MQEHDSGGGIVSLSFLMNKNVHFSEKTGEATMKKSDGKHRLYLTDRRTKSKTNVGVFFFIMKENINILNQDIVRKLKEQKLGEGIKIRILM